ncbi:hypothetical protein NK6_5626 [Bradyrhizobium diazoefficiens]|uniref:Uncharacterized protein n=1 Tax=Bradyrhizobium diazoefficiens TaxID=1355477 RepID=A0A0E4FVC8_9BRAD|nr:hypothetical protein NK6_5626 [Bradyrhizobium diazoefficiens]
MPSDFPVSIQFSMQFVEHFPTILKRERLFSTW